MDVLQYSVYIYRMHTEDMRKGRRCPLLTYRLALYLIFLPVSLYFPAENSGTLLHKVLSKSHFLASVTRAALFFSLFAPPGVHQQTSRLEWHNGFGQWDARGAHKWTNKGAGWSCSPVSKCHTQWVTDRSSHVSIQLSFPSLSLSIKEQKSAQTAGRGSVNTWTWGWS